jgi:hypothetical protein
MLSLLAVGTALALLVPAATPKKLEADVRAWHEKRIQELTADDGFLTLVGLYWLDEGETTAGSDEENALVLPAKLPAKLGTFTRQGSDVSFQPDPGAEVKLGGKRFEGGALKADAKGAPPDVLELGSYRFHVIQRGDQVGLRLKDSEAKARKEFHGIERFPVSRKWRIAGRFEPFETPMKILVPTVLGTIDKLDSPGTVAFSAGGKEYRLYPVLEPGSESLFFVFGDLTNKTDTYGAGRFLYADPPKGGKVVLDFNRAFNPPCVFSPYATCPLPPAQNKLPLRIEAGEKRYGAH